MQCSRQRRLLTLVERGLHFSPTYLFDATHTIFVFFRFVGFFWFVLYFSASSRKIIAVTLSKWSICHGATSLGVGPHRQKKTVFQSSAIGRLEVKKRIKYLSKI